MKMHRLYVGHTDQHGMLTFKRDAVHDEIVISMKHHGFDAATLTDSVGIWKGKPEATTVVGIAIDEISLQRLERMASDIAYVLDQECIMLENPEGKVHFVGPYNRQDPAPVVDSSGKDVS